MITIFTATYNRGYVIERLYQSLRRQSCKEFEWIVIDDGSTDNTESLFQKWLREEKTFSIRYKKTMNGGKHRAINIGVNMAISDAFFCVDSDDYLLDNAVEVVKGWFESISNNQEIAGVSGLRGYSDSIPLGGWAKFRGDYVDATNLERGCFGLLQDKAEIYKTSFLRKYSFPEFEGENFLPEGIVWNKIARDGYKIRWYNKIIYICEYMDDGLTRRGYKRSVENPKGYMEYLRLMSEIYGKSYGEIHKFGFYFVLRLNNSMNSCMEKMHISLYELNELEKKYEQMILEMNQYFQKNSLRNVAVYGMGNVGSLFLELSKELDVNLKYAIDKRHIKNKKIRIYSIDEQWPKVDAVIITLKDYNKKVEAILKNKFSRVIYWKDISQEYWVDQKVT